MNKQSNSSGLPRNQQSIRNFTAPRANASNNTSTEVAKRKRADNLLHKEGNPTSKLKLTSNPPKSSQSRAKADDDVNRKLDSNGDKLDEVLRAIHGFNNRVDSIEERVMINSENICDAGQRLNYLEQRLLNPQMEINGLDASDVPNHLLREEVIKFIIECGISINPEHVIESYKFNRTIKGQQSTIIIVTFMHEAIKRRVITEKIRNDKRNGNRQVFFSDVLTKTNRQILMQARQLKKSQRIFSAWTISGEVFIKTHENSEKFKVTSIEQLSSLNQSDDRGINSDESEYEMITHTRPSSSNADAISNQATSHSTSFNFNKSAEVTNKKLSSQEQSSAQIFNYRPSVLLRPSSIGNNTKKLLIPKPSALRISNNPPVTTNNSSNAANNSTIPANNSATPANNSSIFVKNSSNPANNSSVPANNSTTGVNNVSNMPTTPLMGCDSPLIPSQATVHLHEDLLLNFTNATGQEENDM